MENKFKEIKLCKIEEEFLNLLIKKRNFTKEKARQMLRHDVWTISQFVELTGKAQSTVRNLIILGKQKKGKMIKALNTCYCFPTEKSEGLLFIIRDDLSMEILLKSLR